MPPGNAGKANRANGDRSEHLRDGAGRTVAGGRAPGYRVPDNLQRREPGADGSIHGDAGVAWGGWHHLSRQGKYNVFIVVTSLSLVFLAVIIINGGLGR